MPNRRRFLQGAVALSAAPGAAGAATPQSGAPAVDLVLYDERFAPSRAFGQAALSLGARVRRISGDITDIWQRELHGQWRAAPRPIAGLTLRSAMFCLEQLGWDHGLRVAYRAAHAGESGDAWAAGAAQTLVAMPLPAGPAPDMLSMAASHDDEFTLYSWIIAPARTRARTA